MINYHNKLIVSISMLFFLFLLCAKDNSLNNDIPVNSNLSNYFNINFNALPNYADQYIPAYISKDNTSGDNTITNEGATLGRILFYDTNLSTNKSGEKFVHAATCF